MTNQLDLAEADNASNSTPRNAPTFKARAGAINAACWTKDVSTKDGELFVAYEVKLDRSYQDKQGEWQTGQAMYVTGERDLINLSIAVNEMLGQVRQHRKEDAKKTE